MVKQIHPLSLKNITKSKKNKSKGELPLKMDMNLSKYKLNKKMKIIKTKFKGLVIVKQKNNIDKRGSREKYLITKI